MTSTRVLVIGGYGFFGRRLVARLARAPGREILVAGRSLDAAQRMVAQLQPAAGTSLTALYFDVDAPSLADRLRALSLAMVIDTAGPFQGRDYRLPAACIAAGVSISDLADGRDYVAGIDTLHAAAVAAGVFVTSGASSVPALSSAAADRLAQGMARVARIDIGISPGNRTERGLATVRAALGYCGQPLPTTGPAGQNVHGWSGTRRHGYPPPVGPRLLSPCDVPDLVLLPPRYAGAPAVQFGAGLELAFMHRGMNLMAWLTRVGVVRDWTRHAQALKVAADWFRHHGSDAGAMHVTLTGASAEGDPIERTWTLTATHGDGPFVPTLAAAAVVRKLEGRALPAGARPCIGLLSLDDFEREAKGLAITMAMAP